MLILNLLSAGKGRQSVPIFPLGTVLFPGAVLPLRIFEARYMDMAKDCLKRDSPFGICLIREGSEVGAPAIPEPVGCLARISEADMVELGILKVKAQGLERFRIRSAETGKQGLIIGEVEHLGPEETSGAGEEAPLQLAESAGFLRKAIAGIGEGRFGAPFQFDDASWVSFRIAEILPLRNDVKQKLLELRDASVRLAILHKFLRQQNLIG
jgi:Lon protease-like protein